MRATIAVLATLDTKGPEAALHPGPVARPGAGRASSSTAASSSHPLDTVADVSSDDVARHSGSSIAAAARVGHAGQGGRAMRTMLADYVDRPVRPGGDRGGIGIGGAEGAVMTAAALMRLPLGAPKIVISPIASGRHEFGPLVGTRDMMVMHSVVDILGLNQIARAGLRQRDGRGGGHGEHGRSRPRTPARAPDALRGGHDAGQHDPGRHGLARRAHRRPGSPRWSSTPTASAGRRWRSSRGEGYFRGVIDFTTNEVTDPLVGGIHDGGPDRLRVVGELGLPQVVVPGCIDFAVFEPSRIPPALAGRPSYDHNPEFRLIRTSRGGHAARSPVSSPSGSTRRGARCASPSHPRAVHPEHPGRTVLGSGGRRRRSGTVLRKELRDDIPVSTHDYHVNDPEFGRVVARLFLDLLQETPA